MVLHKGLPSKQVAVDEDVKTIGPPHPLTFSYGCLEDDVIVPRFELDDGTVAVGGVRFLSADAQLHSTRRAQVAIVSVLERRDGRVRADWGNGSFDRVFTVRTGCPKPYVPSLTPADAGADAAADAADGD